MAAIICWLRGYWRTALTGAWLKGVWVEGHDYVEQPNTPKNVFVCKCETCGQVNVAWGE